MKDETVRRKRGGKFRDRSYFEFGIWQGLFCFVSIRFEGREIGISQLDLYSMAQDRQMDIETG